MHDYATLKAETVTRDPSPRQICLFQAGLWGAACRHRAGAPELRPGFAAGGFAIPGLRRDNMVILDAGMALPPSGGYVEEAGRNRHADGCSSSLLVMPPRRGDPCVNHVHLIAGTVQPEHHHPSDRIGMVVRGSGLAHHESGPRMILYPGRAWKIPAGERHHFETSGEPLDLLVFQPDSAWSPTGGAQPLLDATIL